MKRVWTGLVFLVACTVLLAGQAKPTKPLEIYVVDPEGGKEALWITPAGQAILIDTGSPGGRTIINTVLETIVDAVDFGMNAQEAVDASRFHHQWLPDEVTFERNAIPDSTAQRLQAMGHTLRFAGQQGDGHTIILKDGVAYGANDRRSADSKASVP